METPSRNNGNAPGEDDNDGGGRSGRPDSRRTATPPGERDATVVSEVGSASAGVQALFEEVASDGSVGGDFFV